MSDMHVRFTTTLKSTVVTNSQMGVSAKSTKIRSPQNIMILQYTYCSLSNLRNVKLDNGWRVAVEG